MKNPAPAKKQLEKDLSRARARIARLESLKKEHAAAEKKSAALNKRLRKLAELSITLSGDPKNVFTKIARMIAELLGVPIVCLSEIRGDELFFLSVYNRGKTISNAGKCPLKITPCATVEKSKEFQVFDYVAEKFPKADYLGGTQRLHRPCRKEGHLKRWQQLRCHHAACEDAGADKQNNRTRQTGSFFLFYQHDRMEQGITAQ